MNDASSSDVVRYITTAEAARRFAVTPDYIAFLARQAKISARHAGRQWYVDSASLDSFLAAQNALKEQRNSELSNELRRVAERSGASKRTAAAYPTHARTPASLIPPEITAVREPAQVFDKVVAATLAIALTGSVAAATSQAFRADAAQAINAIAAIASEYPSAQSAAVTAAIQPASPLHPDATSSPQNKTAKTSSDQTIIERVIEQPILQPAGSERLALSDDFVTQDELSAQLLQLSNTLTEKFSAPTSPIPQNVAANGSVVALSAPIVPAIDTLSNVAITNPTQSGGSISNASVGATSLSVSGDSTLSGNLSVSGTLSANASSTGISAMNVAFTNATSTNLAVTNLTSYTAPMAPYLTATSTTASSLPYASSTSLTLSGEGFFNGGYLAPASSTVGSGSQSGGLTILGGATTTGNAYFAGSLGIGTSSPSQAFGLVGNAYLTGGLGVGVATTTAGVLQTSGNTYIGGNLTVIGNSLTLGTSTFSKIAVNSSIISDLIPDQNITRNLGSPSFYWNNAYVGTLNANNIAAASSTIAGTSNSSFTIDSANASADQQNSELIFFRGTAVPNALLSWNAATSSKRFEFNQPLYINNASASTTEPTLALQGVSGQTANIIRVASSSGTTIFSVDANGNATVNSLTVNGTTNNTGLSTFANSSTTNATISGSAWLTGLTASSLLAVDQNNKIIASSTIGWNLLKGPASSILAFDNSGNPIATTSIGVNYLTGTLPAENGGTGSTTLTGILKGNGTGAVQTAVGGTDYEFPLTFSTGLNRTGNTVTNTSILSIGSGYATTTGTAISISTSTLSWNGLTLGSTFAVSASGITVTPTVSGTISNSGLADSTISGVSLGSNLANLTAPDNTLTFSGAYNGGTARTVGLNLANGNFWSGLQQFQNASTSLFSAYGPAYFGATATSSFATNGALNLAGLGTFSNGFVSQASSTIVGPLTLTGTLSTQGQASIGTTLAVNGTTGTTTIASGQGFTVGGSQFVVQQGSGNVGIGTTTPANPFDLEATDTGNGLAAFQYSGLASGAATFISLGKAAAANERGGLEYVYNTNSALQQLNLGFAGQGDDQLSISGNGNVGIGTTSPQTLLGLQGGIGVNSSQLYLASNGNVGIGTSSVPRGSNSRLIIGATSGVAELELYGNSTSSAIGYDGSNLNFWVNGTSWNDAMVLSNSGNVGIGTTTSPSAQVSILGTSGAEASNAGILALETANNLTGLRMGISDSNNAWIQSFNSLPLLINPGGNNVGIGTTTPQGPLDVFSNNNASNAYQSQLVLEGSANQIGMNIYNVQSGAHSWGIWSSGVSASPAAGLNFYDLTSGAVKFTLSNAGNVGIGTTSPGSTLSVDGNIYGNSNFQLDGEFNVGGSHRIASYNGKHQIFGDLNATSLLELVDTTTGTTGAVMGFTYDNTTGVGNISITSSATLYNTTSDRRLKENIATTTGGLATLMQIPVDDFDFINDPTHTQVQGFIAQSLYPIYPEAVTTNGDNGIVSLGPTSTPWSVDYGRLTPLIVSAVQDIANITSTFQQNLIAWLGDAANGITDLFAQNIHAQNELCVGSTCVTPAQFQAMVAASGQSAAQRGDGNQSTDAATSSSDATATPPVLEVNGNNPASIQIGAVYNDLGATITGPQQDLNLGIHASVDGGATTTPDQIQIDTSHAGTHTILYSATDKNGSVGYATRTVNVVLPEPALVSSPSTVPTSDASSTAASSTTAIQVAPSDATTSAATSTSS